MSYNIYIYIYIYNNNMTYIVIPVLSIQLGGPSASPVCSRYAFVHINEY